jgi:hypothetical protein
VDICSYVFSRALTHENFFFPLKNKKVLISAWASTVHLLIFHRSAAGGPVRLDVRAAVYIHTHTHTYTNTIT